MSSDDIHTESQSEQAKEIAKREPGFWTSAIINMVLVMFATALATTIPLMLFSNKPETSSTPERVEIMIDDQRACEAK